MAAPLPLPEGCSETEARAYFATIDHYGGAADQTPTVFLKCICSYRRDGNHVMVSDHNWLDHDDAQKVIALADPEGQMATEEGGSRRPKRGTKIFLTAKVAFYGSGGGGDGEGKRKAKIAHIERIELRPFIAPNEQEPYFNKETGVKIEDSPLWHGYHP